VIKLNLKHPSGFEFSYEGPEEGLQAALAVVSEELKTTLQVAANPVPKPVVAAHAATGDDDAAQADSAEDTPLDARAIAERFEAVGARTDIERLTVVAQAAIEAGHDGLDYGTLDRVFLEMGLKRPPKWRPTFSNARTRGYVQNIGRGLWKPTVIGQNFALLGERAPARKPRATRTNNGGDDD
jgi:hypothetical protein